MHSPTHLCMLSPIPEPLDLFSTSEGYATDEKNFSLQREAWGLSLMEEALQAQATEVEREIEFEISAKPIMSTSQLSRPLAPRLKLTIPEPEYSSFIVEVTNPDGPTLIGDTLGTDPNDEEHWHFSPKPFACLSLQERITLGKVRSRIMNMNDPDIDDDEDPEEAEDGRFVFLVRQPYWVKHPFYCSNKLLTQTLGFKEPTPGECEEDDGASGADNRLAIGIMEDCELQEMLDCYRIGFRSRGECSPLVSPMGTTNCRADWYKSGQCKPESTSRQKRRRHSESTGSVRMKKRLRIEGRRVASC